MVPTNPLRIAGLAFFLVVAAHVPAGAVDPTFACGGVAPLFLGCEESDVLWTRNTSIDFTNFTGRVVLLATWMYKPGETHYSGVVCEGPVAVQQLPPHLQALAPPPGCVDFAYPREAPIASGKYVHLTCEAQSREIAPEQWIGPAGPWSCGILP